MKTQTILFRPVCDKLIPAPGFHLLASAFRLPPPITRSANFFLARNSITSNSWRPVTGYLQAILITEMSSLPRILASRANGAKSRGPVSPEGKRASAMNAVRHGLTAQTVVLSNESRNAFETLLAEYHETFQPQNRVEADLVTEMAVTKWRQQRAWAMEAAVVDFEMDRRRAETDKRMEKTDEPTRSALAFRAVEAEDKSMSLFLRYEGRMGRGYKRALDSFERIAALELPNEPRSPVESTSADKLAADFEHE
jgi:hypothetical protein